MSFTYSDPSSTSKFLTVTWSWLGDGAGAVVSETTRALLGFVVAVQTNPGATAPTDNYDVAITNADGVDVLLAAGADRDTTNSEIAYPKDSGIPVLVPFSGALTFALTNNSVAAALGTVTLFIAVPR